MNKDDITQNSQQQQLLSLAVTIVHSLDSAEARMIAAGDDVERIEAVDHIDVSGGGDADIGVGGGGDDIGVGGGDDIGVGGGNTGVGRGDNGRGERVEAWGDIGVGGGGNDIGGQGGDDIGVEGGDDICVGGGADVRRLGRR